MNKLNINYMDIEELVPYINNPRKNTAAVDKVAASIKEFGFKNPIIVDADNVIIAGHTRTLAAKKLGIKEVPVIKADDLTEAQIKAFRIADNKTTEFAEWDLELLEIEMESLKNMDFDLDITGFDEGVFDFEDTEIERTDISDTIKDEFQVIIDCENEQELEKMYDFLTKEGIKCRISTY